MNKVKINVTEDVGVPAAFLDEAREASDRISILAHRVSEDGIPVFTQTTSSVAKILRSEGVEVGLVPSGVPVEYQTNRGLEWVSPVLFISGALYSRDPNAVAVALNLISAYLHDMFRGRKPDPKVSLSILCERRGDHSLRRVDYRGPLEGLREIQAAIQTIIEGDDANRKC